MFLHFCECVYVSQDKRVERDEFVCRFFSSTSKRAAKQTSANLPNAVPFNSLFFFPVGTRNQIINFAFRLHGVIKCLRNTVRHASAHTIATLTVPLIIHFLEKKLSCRFASAPKKHPRARNQHPGQWMETLTKSCLEPASQPGLQNTAARRCHKYL